MTAEALIARFDRLAEAPLAIPRMRRFITDLAIRGRLVGHDLDEGTGGDLPALLGHKSQRKTKPLPVVEEAGDTYRLPANWTLVPLIALGEWATGSGFPVSEQGRLDAPFLFVKVGDMNLPGNEKFIFTAQNTIDRAGATRMRAKLHPSGTIIFPKIGGAIATNKRRILTRESAIDNNCLGLTFAAELDSEWCYLLMTSLDLTKYQAGTAMPALQQGTLARVPVWLPPVAEQGRIVAKVNELMTACDQLAAAQINRERQRDRLASSLLRELSSPDARSLTRRVRRVLQHTRRIVTLPQHLPGMRRAILDLAVDGRLTPADPPGWRDITLGSVGRWGSGGTPDRGRPEYYGGPIPWVVIGDLNGGLVTRTEETITEAGLARSSAKLVGPGAVLVAMYGASVGKLGIAGMECATNQAIAHCIPDPSMISQKYLFVLLQSMRELLVERGRGGAQPNISQAILKAWPVRLPPLSEQQSIVSRVDELMAVCDALGQNLVATENGRARLLEAILREALIEEPPASEVATAA